MTSSAHTVTASRSPVAPNTASMITRSDDVTSACGRPAALTSVSSSRAPGRSETCERASRETIPSSSHLASCSRGMGLLALPSR